MLIQLRRKRSRIGSGFQAQIPALLSEQAKQSSKKEYNKRSKIHQSPEFVDRQQKISSPNHTSFSSFGPCSSTFITANYSQISISKYTSKTICTTQKQRPQLEENMQHKTVHTSPLYVSNSNTTQMLETHSTDIRTHKNSTQKNRETSKKSTNKNKKNRKKNGHRSSSKKRSKHPKTNRTSVQTHLQIPIQTAYKNIETINSNISYASNESLKRSHDQLFAHPPITETIMLSNITSDTNHSDLQPILYPPPFKKHKIDCFSLLPQEIQQNLSSIPTFSSSMIPTLPTINDISYILPSLPTTSTSNSPTSSANCDIIDLCEDDGNEIINNNIKDLHLPLLNPYPMIHQPYVIKYISTAAVAGDNNLFFIANNGNMFPIGSNSYYSSFNPTVENINVGNNVGCNVGNNVGCNVGINVGNNDQNINYNININNYNGSIVNNDIQFITVPNLQTTENTMYTNIIPMTNHSPQYYFYVPPTILPTNNNFISSNNNYYEKKDMKKKSKHKKSKKNRKMRNRSKRKKKCIKQEFDCSSISHQSSSNTVQTQIDEKHQQLFNSLWTQKVRKPMKVQKTPAHRKNQPIIKIPVGKEFNLGLQTNIPSIVVKEESNIDINMSTFPTNLLINTSLPVSFGEEEILDEKLKQMNSEMNENNVQLPMVVFNNLRCVIENVQNDGNGVFAQSEQQLSLISTSTSPSTVVNQYMVNNTAYDEQCSSNNNINDDIQRTFKSEMDGECSDIMHEISSNAMFNDDGSSIFMGDQENDYFKNPFFESMVDNDDGHIFNDDTDGCFSMMDGNISPIYDGYFMPPSSPQPFLSVLDEGCY